MGYRVTLSFFLYASRKKISLILLAAFWIAQCLFLLFLPSNALAWGEFTYKDELELGRKFTILIKSRMPLVEDPEVTRYMQTILDRLSKNIPSQPFPFSINVIKNPSINAFATPGGYLFINTGLILAMEHEAEVAAVMSHEMAHITQRHIARQIENSRIIGILSAIGALAGAFLGGEAGTAAVAGSLAAGETALLKYGREDENEADQVGMNYLKKSGYNVAGFVSSFQKMSKKQWTMGSTLPVYLSTHPNLQERIRNMSTRIGILPGKPIAWNQETDDEKFFRMQTLIRARYSDSKGATVFFTKQRKGKNRSIALLGLGIIASNKNNIHESSRYFEEALSCSPSDELIVREAGRFHYLKGNKQKGMELLAQAVKMDRSDLMALYFYARGLAESGNTSQAVNYMQRLLRLIPEDAEVHYLIGQYYGTTKDLFNANIHLAYSYLYSNNKNKVEQFLSKAKKLMKTDEQKTQIKRFERLYKERKEFWQ